MKASFFSRLLMVFAIFLFASSMVCQAARSTDAFDSKLKTLRKAAEVETVQVARKLIDSLETASDLDLSELKIARRALYADGCYPPYGPGPVYPPSYPCYPPPPM